MKHLHVIALLFGALMVACNRPVETQNFASLPHTNPALQAIDSLMWRQPDSAFAQLRQFVASPQADSLDEFNVHYCQLLISELLYKNYYGQTNREELLQAVAYFDSLTIALNDNSQPRNRHCGLDPQSPDPCDNLAFLDARAHYINGAGYYERDSVVEACAEYLKTLEVMEAHFEEKAQKGKKTVFMFYTYNRLLELFSSQFMLDPALTCGEKALACCQSEPSLFEEIPNTCFYIGKQHDMKGEISVAMDYYEMAIERMTVTDSPMYRDIVSMKALCDYQLGLDAEQSLNTIKQTITNVQGESERSARFLIIGSVYSEEGLYDSALRYFELVFQDEVDVNARICAAESMRILYDSLGDTAKANECLRFLTDHKKTEGENKALVSKLEDMFKTYMDQKQEKEAEEARKRSIQKTVESIISFAVVIVLSIIVFAKHRSKKLLKEQQAEADRMLGETKQQHQEELEAERQTHRMEQAAMSGRLKRSNQELLELRGQIKQLDELAAKTKAAASFNDEPVCRLILERVKEGQFKTKVNYANYKDYALSKSNLLDLRLAADQHFNQFTHRLKMAYPKITNTDLDYCCLYLLGLTDGDVAALMQRSYNTVIERNGKMRKIFGSNRTLPTTLMEIANAFHQFD